MALSERLSRKRGSIKAKLTSFSKYTNLLEQKLSNSEKLTQTDIITLEERVDRISKLIDEFEDVQIQIEGSTEDLEKEYQEREDFYNIYYSEVAKAKHIIKEEKRATANPVENDIYTEENIAELNLNKSNNHFNNVKLPTIHLPRFDGAYQHWLEFKDTFQSLIHDNNCISDIQKYHYLRSSLEDGAAQVIKSIELSSNNYKIAWNTLCERFDNATLLTHNHIKALFNLEVIQKESSDKTRKLVDDVSKNIRSLEQLNQLSWETLVMYLISTKLDTSTIREWEKFKIEKKDPTLNDLKSFLRSKANILETLESNSNERKYFRPHINTKAFLSNNMQCNNCKKEHYISNCSEFLKLTPQERAVKVKELKLCLNCLRVGHFSNICRMGNCKKCNAKHHTLLHMEKKQHEEPKEITSEIENNSKQVNYTLSFHNETKHVLLSTTLVHILDKNNKIWTARALLDSGSQSNFITSELCKQLNLNTSDINLSVAGLNFTNSKINQQCETTIQSMHTAYNTRMKLLVVPGISGNLPTTKINIDFSIPNNIKLADPSFYKPGKVDILIGAELFWHLICIGQHSLGPNKPILQKTRFGWIISGPINSQILKTKTHCNFIQNTDIQEQLSKFWEIEELQSTKLLSKEEIDCENHYQKHTTRDESGRFIVSLPFKEPLENLGDSFEQAKRRFELLEKRLEKNKKLKEMYLDFLLEYEKLGHMNKVDKEDGSKFVYYMPHHGVLREDSLTTKLRVVFDASAPTTSGYSLNNLQMTGPTIQQDLFSILLRFRKHYFVIAGDVEKMYRQILVNPNQRALQRIVWRNNPSDTLQVYNLNTVTYGTRSAPFLAIRSLIQVGKENESEFPRAAKIIQDDFYVDDLLTGANTIEEAIQIVTEVMQILKSGGFDLRKFYSNNPEILKHIQEDNSSRVLQFGENENAKTLGLIWCPTTDKLLYKINETSNKERITKRTVLSNISQVFDPLGLLSPCIIVAKSMLQKIWLEKLSWDECFPQNLHNKWLEFRNELSILNDLRIQRNTVCINPVRIEIHGFSDASESAYGACIYIRSTDASNNTSTSLLCSKTKVAPLKTISMPRLELCGAFLLAKLINKVNKVIDMKFDDCFLWTDSVIVLCWLKTSPSCLKSFVANRISEIQQLTSSYQWRHVPSIDNPADLASRGISPSKILNAKLWWEGPKWLAEAHSKWPSTIKQVEEMPEMRKNIHTLTVLQKEESFPFHRYSKLSRLNRIIAYMIRFKNNCQKRIEERRKDILTLYEVNEAFNVLIKIAQKESFSEEISSLNKGKFVKPKSKLSILNPFMDNTGILRVGGRISNSEFSYDKKHPIVLSGNHHLTVLIFEDEHVRLLHAGPQLLLASIRQKFWPIRGRSLARNIVRRCIKCFRFNPKALQRTMGNLPPERLQAKFPFHVTGVDYAGPFVIKDRKGRGSNISKCYICLFVCFSVKAVHLELVTDLTKESFILSLKRFISRRGKPIKIFSDNGTNFIAANNELKYLGEFLASNSQTLIKYFNNEKIDWEFIPPQSPHFGGLWEAGIKSCKHHLKRVIGLSVFTFEEFYSLLVQVEAILNSRPLSPLSSDPSDLNPLTPAHFLIGRPLTSVQEEHYINISANRLSYYKHIQAVQQHFWERWNKEYISELQIRYK